jgi:hypothetical protein
MQYAYVELEDAGRRWTTFVCAFPETIDAPNIHRLLLALSLMQSSRAFGVRTAQQLVAFTLILPLSHELLDRFLVKGLRRYWVS